MSRLAFALATFMIFAFAAQTPADGLGVGDQAPKLEVKEFVKGQPVKSLEKGHTYVVEFWATWCGPCKATIPHLTELQKKYKDVTFIGVSVYEQDKDGKPALEKVRPFVEEMGARMDYRVATDDVPKDGKPADGKMAKGWMDAAAQDGIPTAFVVNGDGKVAWIGHPMNMEKPLDQIAKGTWDLVAATKEFKIAQASALRLRELMANLSKARKSGDPKDMLAVLDKAFESDAALEERFGPMKLTLLLKQGSPEKSAEYGKHLALALQDNAQGLNNIAWMIVDPAAKKADGALIKLAFDAAKRADELMHGKDGAIADTLAAAYAAQGDFAKALQAEERALDLAKGTPLEKDETMKQRLEEYKKAVKK